MNKQQVFYIHGGSAYTNHDDFLRDLRSLELRSPSDEEQDKKWPATLRSQLGEQYQVFTPSMPNSENAKYEEWKIWFERHFTFLRDGLVLVCWSQGAMFIAKYLSENTVPFSIKALYLLAGPYDYYISSDSREDGGDFYPDQENLNLLSGRIDDIYILHSKDDFVVPYEHALKYKAALPEAELITFEDKNHFLVEELPELVDLIKGLAI